MKFNATLTEIVRFDLEVGLVPALIGEAGIGKSSFVEALAAAMATKAFVLPCNQLGDKTDLTGARLHQTADGSSYQQSFFPHEVVVEAIDYAEKNPREWPILFFDEINRTTSDVTSGILTMITLRRLGRSHLPSNLRIMIAGNDKGNVTALDEASLSRFSIYHVEPEAQTLISILGNDINRWIKATLVKHPHLVFERSKPAGFLVDGQDDDEDATVTMAELADNEEEMLQITTPRTIEGASKLLNTVPEAKLLEWFQTPSEATRGDGETLLHEILEGHLGSTEFNTHLVAEIALEITSGMNGQQQTPSFAMPKPNCYDSLKAASTINELERLIADLTDRERSGSLAYALFEKADNTNVVRHLAQQTPAFEQDDLGTVVRLVTTSALDVDNVAVLKDSGTPVGDTIRNLFTSLGH